LGRYSNALEGRDRAVQIGERGHDDDRQAGQLFLDLLQQIQTRATRHANVAHEDLRPLALGRFGQGLEHLLRVGETACRQVLAQQGFLQHEAD
jgi:hypothetical protein